MQNGEITLLGRLGGQVYRARRTRDGAELAVRLLHPRTPALLDQGLALAAAASGVRHAALAHIEGFGELAAGEYYIASELVHGRSLLVWNSLGMPTLAQVLRLTHSLCSGLALAARARVTHDALHPRNVRVLDNLDDLDNLEADSPVKLLDLGVPAPLFEREPDAQTLCFMAPEQLTLMQHGPLPDTCRCDQAMNVYSCGSVLYYLAIGRAPYPGGSVAELTRLTCEARRPTPARAVQTLLRAVCPSGRPQRLR